MMRQRRKAEKTGILRNSNGECSLLRLLLLLLLRRLLLRPGAGTVLEQPLLLEVLDESTQGLQITLFEEIEGPRKVDEVDEETVKMGLQAHVENLVEMGVVNMSKDAEHLLIDALASLLKRLREAAFFTNPSLSAAREAAGITTGNHGGGSGSGRSGCTTRLGGEYCLVIDSVIDPLENVFDVGGSGEAHRLLVGVKPGVVETGASRHGGAVPGSTELVDDTIEAIQHVKELEHVEGQPLALIDILGKDNDRAETSLDQLTSDEGLAEEKRLRGDSRSGRGVRHETAGRGSSGDCCSVESATSSTTSSAAAGGLRQRRRLLLVGFSETTKQVRCHLILERCLLFCAR